MIPLFEHFCTYKTFTGLEKRNSNSLRNYATKFQTISSIDINLSTFLKIGLCFTSKQGKEEAFTTYPSALWFLENG